MKYTLRALQRIRLDHRVEICTGSVFLADARTAAELLVRDLVALEDPAARAQLIAEIDELDRQAA
jgi:hypothetical protein